MHLACIKERAAAAHNELSLPAITSGHIKPIQAERIRKTSLTFLLVKDMQLMVYVVLVAAACSSAAEVVAQGDVAATDASTEQTLSPTKDEIVVNASK